MDDDFHCKKCGSKGEQLFDWKGNCLVCEELIGDDE